MRKKIMKNKKWMLTLLIAFCMSAPVFAQNIDAMSAKVQKAIEAANIKAAQANCTYCGKQVAQGQHCSARAYAALCTAQEAAPRAAAAAQPEATCAKCGEKLNIDQRYHGAKHECKADGKQAKSEKYCIYCGEQIKSDGQTCSAQGHNARCTNTCPECGLDLNNPENLSKDGKHRCKFKLTIKPAEQKK